MDQERRIFKINELRVNREDEKRRITGYAAVFNSLSEDLGGWYETIEPGAFGKTLDEYDQRALWNHNSDYVLGRRSAGTLALDEDETGLRFEIDPPDTQWARDLLISLDRGDVDQMSFGFQVIRDEWKQVADQIVRRLVEVKLFEVSPVAFPAYPATSAQVRSKLAEFQRNAAPVQEDHPAAPGANQTQAGLDFYRRRLMLAEKSLLTNRRR